MRTTMKRWLVCLSVFLLACTTFMWAQGAGMTQVMKKYRSVHTLTASVVRIKHNVAFAEDARLDGKLYFKAPGRMCMRFEGDKDMLLMEGNEFTMVESGRKSVAKGQTQAQFESLVEVFKQMVLGMDISVSPEELAEVKMEEKDGLCTLTVIPRVDGGNKVRRRLLFSSFVLTVDLQKGECKSLQMNERGQNYTRYDFSGFMLDAHVPDTAFQLP